MVPVPPLSPWPTLATGKNPDVTCSTPLTLGSFAEKVVRAVKGEKGIVEPSFVYLPGVSGGDAIQKATGCEFFSVPIELGVSIT